MKNYEKRNFELGRETRGELGRKELHVTGFYQSSPIDSFLVAEHKPANSSKKSLRITSDIYMLFNQQRLDKMTQQALSAHFEQMRSTEPAFVSLKSKLSDEQLASIVKSRYIQTPSELIAYSRYLNTLADADIQALVTAAQQKSMGGSPAEPADPTSPAE